MSLILTICYIALQGVQALPTGNSSEGLASAPSPPRVRTKSTIIWSCLVTIFSCTWIAVHPNIPEPDTPRWRIFLRRAWLMVITVIAPEVVLIWAIRQWIVADQLDLVNYKWTQSHGFFAIMGGFMIYKSEGDKNSHTAKLEEIEELLSKGELKISKREIQDQGRGDALSKGLILIQTTWFIIQCIARTVERLPITGLELVTLAFAVLNFLTYAVWWNKPLNVGCPVRVYKKGESEDGVGAGSDDSGTAGTESIQKENVWGPKAVRDAVLKEAASIREIKYGNFVRKYRWHLWHPLAVLSSPLIILGCVFVIFGSLGVGYFFGGDDDVIESGAKRVPTFYAGELSTNKKDAEKDALRLGTLVRFAAMVIAIIFGGIHFFAWSSKFPSDIEQLLWRIACITIVVMPLLLFILAVITHLPELWGNSDFSAWVMVIIFIIIINLSVVYIIGRLMLLVLSFMALRSLPAEAYQTVQWMTFIPHI